MTPNQYRTQYQGKHFYHEGNPNVIYTLGPLVDDSFFSVNWIDKSGKISKAEYSLVSLKQYIAQGIWILTEILTGHNVTVPNVPVGNKITKDDIISLITLAQEHSLMQDEWIYEKWKNQLNKL